MGKKTKNDLYLEIESLKENNEKELDHLRKQHEDLKTAFEKLSNKHDVVDLVNKNEKKCSECDLTFKSEREFKLHMRIHRSDRSFECTKCERVFDEEWKLNAHFKNHRENLCQFCEKSFKFKDILEKHIKITHESHKLYCHFYNNKQDCPFKQDCIFLHEDSTPCRYGNLCERINCMFTHELFENEDVAKQDDETEDNEDVAKQDDKTEDIEVICKDCNFIASDKLSLELHNERKHTGFYECVFCEYTADDEQDLNLHLHTCEIFMCAECEPKFLGKNIYDLKAHILRKHSENLNNIDIIHLKLDRTNIDKVSRRKVKSELFL